ncbi:TPR repeat-containing protein [Methanocaldococcus infernus ME]|uniref:TPR repeat-containing protein n=1 Tax=Methanocaldococcus infernus (strain DSM 11812 / JCM 15783 / ME) TaxID=573063 RepID=D5VRX8_METIM|nr:tetratricopeptide repeat protein [Methanocaldococcus infernus]ADG13331.1 TPR repeat-containing protein [Methanocaldococcus infernus ME]
MDVRKYYEKGLKYYNEGRYEKAIECFDKAIKLDPNNPAAWYYKADSLYKLERYEKAIECFDKAIKLDPNNPAAWYYKADSLYKLERYEKAIECFDKAIKLDPNNPAAWYYKADSLYKLERYEKAIECFDKAIKLDPNNPAAWYYKGIILAKLGKHEEESKKYEKALDKYKEAIECFKKVLEIDPNFYSPLIYIFKYLKQRLYSKEKIDEDIFTKIFGLLCKIQLYIIDLKKELIVSDKGVIYHYTKPTVVKNLLNGSYFRLYNVSYMNDPEEGKTLLRIIVNKNLKNLKDIYEIKNEQDVQNFKEDMEFQVFIGSFVVEGDNLFLWRTYGKDENNEEAKGVCIGIKKDFFDYEHDYSEVYKNIIISKNIEFERNIKDIYCLYYVIYEDENNKDERFKKLLKTLEDIDKLVGSLKDLIGKDPEIYETVKIIVRAILDEIRYLVKSKYYKEEKECRVVKVYNLKFHKDKIKLDETHTPPKLYVEIEKDLRDYIEDITLGPRLDNKEHWELYFEYLKNINPEKYEKIELRYSKCNFK